MRLCLILLILLFGTSSTIAVKAAQAQRAKHEDTPSLAKTEHWIENSFNEENVGYVQVSPSENVVDQSYSIVFEGCKFGLESSQVRRYTINGTQKEQQSSVIYYADLRDIDPGSIQVDGYDVIAIRRAIVGLATSNDEKKITEFDFPNGLEELVRPSLFQREPRYNPQRISKVDQVAMGIVMAPDYATRFVKAMRLATKLCGGNRSTF